MLKTKVTKRETDPKSVELPRLVQDKDGDVYLQRDRDTFILIHVEEEDRKIWLFDDYTTDQIEAYTEFKGVIEFKND